MAHMLCLAFAFCYQTRLQNQYNLLKKGLSLTHMVEVVLIQKSGLGFLTHVWHGECPGVPPIEEKTLTLQGVGLKKKKVTVDRCLFKK